MRRARAAAVCYNTNPPSTIAAAHLRAPHHLLGFDPAASSAPFVATLVDVPGFVIYFAVGIVILRGTLL